MLLPPVPAQEEGAAATASSGCLLPSSSSGSFSWRPGLCSLQGCCKCLGDLHHSPLLRSLEGPLLLFLRFILFLASIIKIFISTRTVTVIFPYVCFKWRKMTENAPLTEVHWLCVSWNQREVSRLKLPPPSEGLRLRPWRSRRSSWVGSVTCTVTGSVFVRERRPGTHTVQEKQLRHWGILGPHTMAFHETCFVFIIFRDYL